MKSTHFGHRKCVINEYCMVYCIMSMENLNRASDISQDPSLVNETRIVNVDVLKQRLINEKKKENIKNSIVFSIFLTVLVAIGILVY